MELSEFPDFHYDFPTLLYLHLPSLSVSTTTVHLMEKIKVNHSLLYPHGTIISLHHLHHLTPLNYLPLYVSLACLNIHISSIISYLPSLICNLSYLLIQLFVRFERLSYHHFNHYVISNELTICFYSISLPISYLLINYFQVHLHFWLITEY